MVLLLACLATLFIIISFTSNTSLISLNSFFGYILTQFQFVLQNPVIFGLVFFLLWFFVLPKKMPEHSSFLRRLWGGLTRALQFLILGLLVAYVALFVIAFVHLNILAILLDIKPEIVGVNTNMDAIVKELKNDYSPPNIITSDTDQYNELLTVAGVTTNSDSFYGSKILSSIPYFFIIPTKKPDASVLSIGNTIIITHINREDLEVLSPLIGDLFVQKYFWGRTIKSYPNISVQDEKSYKQFRQEDSKKKSVLITNDIQKIQDAISSLSASIQHDNDTIALNQEIIKQIYAQENKRYSTCMSAGEFRAGAFYHTNSQDDCKKQTLTLENSAVDASQTVDIWKKKLQNDTNQLENYKYYDSFFQSQIKLIQALNANVPHELGIFIPPNSINMVINSTNSQTLADYLETVTHEYLHYASYNPKKSFQDTFFEEGLTEYFARNIIRDELHMNTNLGYPVQVKIITQMTKVIPEIELADIYFTKDEDKLETTLDRVYGDEFYEHNKVLFETLQYSSDPKQTLKLANEIMKKIGGAPLKENDLYSDTSNL